MKIYRYGLMLLISLSASVHAATIEINIKKFKFTPQQLTINVGDTVIWRNVEKRQYHNVWFEKSGEEEPDYFFPDESYQRTFQQVGSFDYRCDPHPKMTGLIVVK